MFRSLQFTEAPLPYTMDPPLSVELVAKESTRKHLPVELRLTPEDLFTTAVGLPSKHTLAKWHVTSPQEIVTELLKLVGMHKDAESESKLYGRKEQRSCPFFRFLFVHHILFIISTRISSSGSKWGMLCICFMTHDMEVDETK